MITLDFSKPDNNIYINKAFPSERMSIFKRRDRTGNCLSQQESNRWSNKLRLKDNDQIPKHVNSSSRTDDNDEQDEDIAQDSFTSSRGMTLPQDKRNSVVGGKMAFGQKYSKARSNFGDIAGFIFKRKLMKNSLSLWERTKYFEFLYTQYLFNCTLQCLFSIMTIASSVIEHEASQNSLDVLGNQQNSTQIDTSNVSRTLINNSIRSGFISSVFSSILSIFLWISIVFDYILSCKITAYFKSIPETIWTRDINNIFWLVLTLIFFLPHPNPLTHGIFVETYNDEYETTVKIPLNGYFTAILLFRLWFLIKFLLATSIYYDPRTIRICEMNSFHTSLWFSLKCIMANWPFEFNTFIFIIVLFMCSYSIRIFEMDSGGSNADCLGNYYNALWCVFVTMTTVGYGDYTPGTAFGRLVIIIGCCFGVFVLSMFVVTVSTILNLKKSERNIFLLLDRADLMEEKDQLARRVVSGFVKVHKQMRQNPLSMKDKKKSLEVVGNMSKFKEKRTEIGSTFPPYSNFDNIIDNLIFLEQTVATFGDKYKRMEKIVQKITLLLDFSEGKQDKRRNINK